MLNKVIICGRLGKDPEKIETKNTIITNINIATDESYIKNDEKVKKTEWHNITAFGKVAESCAKYLSKGSVAIVEGKLQTDKWEDKDGNTRYTTKIIASNVRFVSTNNEKKSDEQSGQSKKDGLPF